MTNNSISPSEYDGKRPDDKYKKAIFNLILQKGPMEFDQIVEKINHSRNKVKMDLLGLHREGLIIQDEVETEYGEPTIMADGKWCVTKNTDTNE